MKQLITLEGRNTIHDALLSDKQIKSLVIGEESAHDVKVQEIIDIARAKHIPISITASKNIKRRSESGNPQNILAEMEIEQLSIEDILESKKEPVFLFFNRLDYEQNLGAILRTAWGGGADAVIVSPNGVHELTPVVAKVSMGGAANVPLISESLFPQLRLLKDKGIPIVGVEEGMGESEFAAE